MKQTPSNNLEKGTSLPFFVSFLTSFIVFLTSNLVLTTFPAGVRIILVLSWPFKALACGGQPLVFVRGPSQPTHLSNGLSRRFLLLSDTVPEIAFRLSQNSLLTRERQEKVSTRHPLSLVEPLSKRSNVKSFTSNSNGQA